MWWWLCVQGCGRLCVVVAVFVVVREGEGVSVLCGSWCNCDGNVFVV